MEITEIIEKKNYFTELTFRHLSSGLKAFDSAEYLSSAIWSAVFVEALLKDMLFELDGNIHSEELNSLINNLRAFANNYQDKKTSPADKNYYRDIAARCHEIRAKRNRLVHDTGVERGMIDIDARDINNNVILIVKQYINSSVGKAIFEKNKARIKRVTSNSEARFPIFISSITPHTYEQGEFLNLFCEKLKEIGVEPVRCILTDFDKKDPMGKVRSTIEKCNAVIVIGLERSHVYFYKDKEGSLEEYENVHRKYTSGWLQIESGMAIALNKEVFVLCQKDIHSDGIFDRSWNSYLPIEIDSPLSIEDTNIKLMLEKIQEFVVTYKK